MYRVMLVDDEPLALTGMKEILDWKKYGFMICSCCLSAEEAQEKIPTLRPDVVFTDIRMTDATGIELIANTRKEEKWNPEFVIVSAYSDFEVARRALALSAAGYLLKPLDVEEVEALLLRIKKVLDDKYRKRKLSLDLNQPASIRQVSSALQELLVQENGKAACYCVGAAMSDAESGEEPVFSRISLSVKGFSAGMTLLFGKEASLWAFPKHMGVSPIHRSSAELAQAVREAMVSYCGRFVYSENSQIREIQYFIGENYEAKISLASLAKQFSFSENYLCALFKRYTGQVLQEFIRNVRLGNACRLLEEGHSVQEVSAMVGFSDYSYFIKVFRRHIGETPRGYLGKTAEESRH